MLVFRNAALVRRGQVKNVVASMGTAVTIEQVKALRNALPADGRVIIALDSDEAGVKAVERACTGVLIAVDSDEKTAGLSINIASLPGDAKDPADFLLVSFYECLFRKGFPFK